MSEEKKLAWRCMHKCKGRSTSVSSKSNIQTPVKIGLTSNCDNELKTMIASLTSKVEGFESILKEVKDSQNFISGMYDEMLNEIKELKKQNQSFKHEVVGLKRKVEDRDGEIEELRMKVNDMDQYNRRFNLEINGVQDAGKEDTIKILERVCGEINVTFDSQHIQAAHPLKQFNAERPPTLIVQFTRKDVRDQWITQGRKAYKNAAA
ncbi:hypothetical protein J6590_071247, partial [Homalodisca vitripennis]